MDDEEKQKFAKDAEELLKWMREMNMTIHRANDDADLKAFNAGWVCAILTADAPHLADKAPKTIEEVRRVSHKWLQKDLQKSLKKDLKKEEK